MKPSIIQNTCPEYHFDFSASGVQRVVPALPGGERNFYGQEYFADYGRIAGAFGCRISDRFADWAELAVAIYIADRFSPRRDLRLRKGLGHRRRIIQIRIAVQDLPFWQSNETKKLLGEALWALTEDEWRFQFFKQEVRLTPCAQEFLLPEKICGPIRVALFSGGLDSFAGAALQLRIPDLTHIFVSGVTHGRMEVGQQQQMSLLRNSVPANVRPLQIWYGLKDKKVLDKTLERSQRSRAFMHVTLGAIAALQAGAKELYMYENGFGALNLPFNATQVGIETSKAANPVFHRPMEKFIERVSGASFQIINPFLFLTKAQSLRLACVEKFGISLADTFSCDRFPDWREGKPQCGTCASCILRRLSLEAADLTDFDSGGNYARDVKSDSFVPDNSSANILSNFEEQATTLDRAFNQANPWLALASDFPELYEIEQAIINDGQNETGVREALLQLLKNQVDEWKTFSGRETLQRFLLVA
jgi:7-cyano-7-deazaguanine synthase in queuosine biosynthesis